MCVCITRIIYISTTSVLQSPHLLAAVKSKWLETPNPLHATILCQVWILLKHTLSFVMHCCTWDEVFNSRNDTKDWWWWEGIFISYCNVVTSLISWKRLQSDEEPKQQALKGLISPQDGGVVRYTLCQRSRLVFTCARHCHPLENFNGTRLNMLCKVPPLGSAWTPKTQVCARKGSQSWGLPKVDLLQWIYEGLNNLYWACQAKIYFLYQYIIINSIVHSTI